MASPKTQKPHPVGCTLLQARPINSALGVEPVLVGSRMNSQAVASSSERVFWGVRSRGGCVSGTVCSSFVLVRHRAGKGAASMKHPLWIMRGVGRFSMPL